MRITCNYAIFAALDHAVKHGTAELLRTGIRLFSGTPEAHPDRVIAIPSRDAGRTIPAHVYLPPNPKTKGLVLINFHGSGWLLPQHGENDEYCRKIANEAGYTVVDGTYRMAPENPFPGSLNDVEDLIKWVLKQDQEYDLKHVAISGFSAGGNMILAAASILFPKDTFNALIAFYPLVDHTIPDRGQPDPSIKPQLSPTILNFLTSNLSQNSNFDRKDPRLSPYYADATKFPKQVLIIVGGVDSLSVDADALHAKLSVTEGRRVDYQKFSGCDHAWDVLAKIEEGSVQAQAKQDAYKLAVNFLR